MPTDKDWEAAAKIYNAEANKGATEAVLIALGVEYGRAQATIEAPPAESEFARRVREKVSSTDAEPLTLETLVRIAAMCQWTAEDCGLIPEAKDATE